MAKSIILGYWSILDIFICKWPKTKLLSHSAQLESSFPLGGTNQPTIPCVHAHFFPLGLSNCSGLHKPMHVWHALLSFIMLSLFKHRFSFQQSVFSDSTPPKICTVHTLQCTYCWILAFAHSERWLRFDNNETTPVVCSSFSFNDPAKRTCVEHGSHL